jgi:hypothetical protein
LAAPGRPEASLPFTRFSGEPAVVADSLLRAGALSGDSVERGGLAGMDIAFIRHAAGDADIQLVYPAAGGGSVVMRLNSARVATALGRSDEDIPEALRYLCYPGAETVRVEMAPGNFFAMQFACREGTPDVARHYEQLLAGLGWRRGETPGRAGGELWSRPGEALMLELEPGQDGRTGVGIFYVGAGNGRG